MRGVVAGLTIFLAVVSISAWELNRLYRAADGALLFDSSEARWIKAERPMDLVPHKTAPTRTVFRRVLELFTIPTELTLRVRSFRDCRVLVNGIPVEPETRGSPHWVTGDRYQIASTLREGRNEVTIAVENRRGPPALLVEADLPKLNTSPAWDVVPQDSGIVVPAGLLAQEVAHPMQGAFPSAQEGLLRVAPFLVGAFLLGFVASAFLFATRNVNLLLAVTPSRLRWLLLCAWAVLCVNGLRWLPPDAGFDVRAHLAYVDFILQHGRLPLAGDGWQTFQSPLYYQLTAALSWLAGLGGGSPSGVPYFVARLLGMLSGFALIEISYRSAHCVFPERPELQSVATLVSGTVPMTFYICQEVGNEPLAGAAGAAALYLCLREVTGVGRRTPVASGAWLGGLFGIALLAKVSAVLLTPVMAWVLWYRYRSHGRRSVLVAETTWLGAACAVSGWYYARNWFYLGRPFVGGWDPARGIDWWQDPGYRTLSDLIHFGVAITHPMYASLGGLWDGLYSTLWLDGLASSAMIRSVAPAWNYDFMVALAPMALPLTLATIVGTILIPGTRESRTRAGLAVSAAAGLCFLAGIAYVYLTVPFYTSMKATYALSMVPALGLLAANGLKPLVGSRWGRAVLSGYLSSWALCAFAAFLAG